MSDSPDGQADRLDELRAMHAGTARRVAEVAELSAEVHEDAARVHERLADPLLTP